jgi:hypothetical protein
VERCGGGGNDDDDDDDEGFKQVPHQHGSLRLLYTRANQVCHSARVYTPFTVTHLVHAPPAFPAGSGS